MFESFPLVCNRDSIGYIANVIVSDRVCQVQSIIFGQKKFLMFLELLYYQRQ